MRVCQVFVFNSISLPNIIVNGQQLQLNWNLLTKLILWFLFTKNFASLNKICYGPVCCYKWIVDSYWKIKWCIAFFQEKKTARRPRINVKLLPEMILGVVVGTALCFSLKKKKRCNIGLHILSRLPTQSPLQLTLTHSV